MYKNFHGEFHENTHVDQDIRMYFPDYSYKGIFLDIGAFEPINISNSYHFERNGWEVHCFEANPNLIPNLKKYRKNVHNYALYNENKNSITFNVFKGYGGGSNVAGLSAVEIDKTHYEIHKHGVTEYYTVQSTQRTLDSVLEIELNHIKTIDVISLDIEGGEIKCLEGFNIKKYNPKVVVIENFYNRSNIHNYMSANGYILDKKIAYNEFYVLKT